MPDEFLYPEEEDLPPAYNDELIEYVEEGPEMLEDGLIDYSLMVEGIDYPYGVDPYIFFEGED